MKPTLIFLAIASLILIAGCHHDESDSGNLASAASVPAMPEGTTHPMEPSTSPPPASAMKSAENMGSYQIPPFPVTGVDVCDHYAQEIRRCMNQQGTDAQRHATETSVKAMLSKVKPKPGQAPNEWLTTDCRRSQQALAMRYKQCAIQ